MEMEEKRDCVCELKSSRFEVIPLGTQRAMHFGVTVSSVPVALTHRHSHFVTISNCLHTWHCTFTPICS